MTRLCPPPNLLDTPTPNQDMFRKYPPTSIFYHSPNYQCQVQFRPPPSPPRFIRPQQFERREESEPTFRKKVLYQIKEIENDKTAIVSNKRCFQEDQTTYTTHLIFKQLYFINLYNKKSRLSLSTINSDCIRLFRPNAKIYRSVFNPSVYSLLLPITTTKQNISIQ